MGIDALSVLLLLGFLSVVFITETISIDVAAAAGLLLLILNGFVTPAEAFSSFSAPVVITMASTFALGAAVSSTGIANRFSAFISRWSRGSETRAVFLVMAVAAGISSVMNNVAATALLLPTVAEVARRSSIPASRLMMPLSFATLLGGTLTLIGTTPNMLVDEVLRMRGYHGFKLFDFFPFGLLWVGAGIAFMVLWGRALLPMRSGQRKNIREEDLPEMYSLSERLYTVFVPHTSQLAGRTLNDAGFERILGSMVVAIRHDGDERLAPRGDDRISGGDTLLVRGRETDIAQVRRFAGLEVSPGSSEMRGLVMQSFVPVLLSVNASMIGKTLRDLDLRRESRLIVCGIQRGDSLLTADVSREVLHADDKLLAVSPRVDMSTGDVSAGEMLEQLLQRSFFEIKIPTHSPLADISVRDSGIREMLGVVVVAVSRGGELFPLIESSDRIRNDDLLIVSGRPEQLALLEALAELEIGEEEDISLSSAEVGLVEAVIPPRSLLIGKTLREASFRRRFGAQVLALWRGGRAYRWRLSEFMLALGDGLLLQAPRARLRQLSNETDLILVSNEPMRPFRIFPACVVGCAILFMLALSLFHLQPIEVSAFLAVILVLLSGALTTEEAYRRIDWRIVVFVACMLPFGTAVERSGLAGAMAALVQPLAVSGGIFFLLALVIVAGSLLSQLLDSTVAIVVLGPVILEVSRQRGVDPRPLMMALALSASIAFMLPFSHRANLLVMSIGGYRTRDYIRVGVPLTAILGLVTWAAILCWYRLGV